MSYAAATIDDVQARMPQFPMTETSKPTKQQAEVFLDDVTAEVDAALENLGYVTPITGEKALLQLRAPICDAAIARILEARAAAVGGDAAIASAKRHQERYDLWLKRLADPDDTTVELIDAERTGDEFAKPIDLVDGLRYDDNGCPIEPHVWMSQKF